MDICCNTFHKNEHEVKNPGVFAYDIFTMHRRAETLKSVGFFGKMRTVTVVSLLEYQKFSNPLSNDAFRCFYACKTKGELHI